ncbi:MAG: DUF2917 domain-containing protein [Planctomycetota bacterium]
METGKMVELRLAERECFPLPLRTGQLTCRAGSVWITEEGSLTDTVLKAGEAWASTTRGRIVISSRGGCCVRLSPREAS